MTGPEGLSLPDAAIEKAPKFGDYLNRLKARIEQIQENITLSTEPDKTKLAEFLAKLKDEKESLDSMLDGLMDQAMDKGTIPGTKGKILNQQLGLYDRTKLRAVVLNTPLSVIADIYASYIEEQEVEYKEYQELSRAKIRQYSAEEIEQFELIPKNIERLQKIISRITDLQSESV